jgi:recombination DNA repair RAD52 pathway protein
MARHHLIDGVKVPFTAEEEAAYDKIKKEWEDGALDRALQNLRDKRNNLLAETDYLALSDNTLSDDMKTYRQNLRDLPAGKDTVEKCENATWPTKP